MWIQSMASFDWNENSVNALAWLEWESLNALVLLEWESLNALVLLEWEYSTVKICQSNLCYTIYPDISEYLKKRQLKNNKCFTCSKL